MKLIVGLGNPGREYTETRHNLGFAVVDRLAERWSVTGKAKRKFYGFCGEGSIAGRRVLLLKPTTYMNRSGKSVLAVCQFYEIPPGNMLVVLDDVDLPLGRIRLRPGGSAGGHKGLADVLNRLDEMEVPRLRLGIGKVDSELTVGHVLSHFAAGELPTAQQVVNRAADASECWLTQGLDAAMNEYNRPLPDDEA
jgi:PTH1 family peptidyl-tRNA hydrolase